MPGEVKADNRRQERVIYWLGENRKNLSLTACYLKATEDSTSLNKPTGDPRCNSIVPPEQRVTALC